MASDVKYLRGTQEQYDRYVELNKIEPMHFYYIDQQKLYLGYLELTNQTDINNAIVSLKAELVDTYAAKTELVELSERFKTVESKIETIELKIKVYDEKITNLESDIVTLKNISLGIGGENEPPTILAAIDNAKNDVISYVDNALSWQTIE
jgi:hypothetical protein